MPPKNRIHVSPWLTIGTSFVLMVFVAGMGVVNYHRDKDRMSYFLKEKGGTLIRAFEAGAESGTRHLQRLLEGTAGQPDISYVGIVDRNGVIRAHSQSPLIGTPFIRKEALSALSPGSTPRWRIVEKEGRQRVFEVYRTFSGMPGAYAIFVGMGISPFETAMEKDLKHNLVMAAIIVSLGIAGLISLFWSRNYTRSHKLLQDTRKLASEVVTHLPEGILVMDPDHRVIYSNRTALHLLGAAPGGEGDAERLLPRPVWALYETIKSGTSRAEKEIRLTPDGEPPVPVAVSGTDIHGRDGDYIGFMFLFKDLTEIRELEIKNRRIEKLAAIGNLAAGIAHEIRNPLSSIKGYVTFFGSLFERGSDNRKAAELMAEEVDRVNRVITELLEFARPSDLKPAMVAPKDLVNHSLRIIAREAEASSVTVLRSLPEDLPEIRADMDRLTQVLLNLYLNALQAMPRGGRLTVGCRTCGDQVIIEVQDTGCGIPETQLARIFDPYFTTKNNGTGLGLAIAHKIVEAHGGSITAARTLKDSGTRISVILPVTG